MLYILSRITSIVTKCLIQCSSYLQGAEEQLKDSEENYEQEKKELQNKLSEKSNEESRLMARIESITAESDFTKEQLSALKAKYENIKNGEISGLIKPVKDSPGIYAYIIISSIYYATQGPLLIGSCSI